MDDGKKIILVAEDEPGLRMLYKRLLGKFYEIREAENGLEAVNCYHERRPDLVLMDIRMPIMNGEEAIREIRTFDPESRIIAVTGCSYSEEKLGVPLIGKPFNGEQLKQKIEEVLAG